MRHSSVAIRLTIIVVFGVSAATLVPTGAGFGQNQAYKQLTAQWWQWALSIPLDQSPLLDATGAKCMVGQRGSEWFLLGTFGGSSATRSCSIPEGVSLFFPVVNNIWFDTPNACGQGPDPLPASFYREQAALFIDGVSNVSVVLDGRAVKDAHRVRSQVFEIALPADNVFAGLDLCALPAGIYSPAVDDGIYVRLNPLDVGSHTLQFHAENPGVGFVLDVTYHLTVVPVLSK